MKHILSIQSHVAFGHVGNRAAVPTLEFMGYEVIPINTVQFSNHTGYGKWKGQVYSAKDIRDTLEGLKDLGVLDKVDGFLTGYLGNVEIGKVILEVVASLPPPTLWLCDPVMGDTDRGFFAQDGIKEFFKSEALSHARIITPNQFELEFLSGHEVKTLDDAKLACDILHKAGCEIVLVTSLIHNETRDDQIQMLASHKNGERYVVTTPRLPLSPAPNGAGDCTSAVFLARNLEGLSLKDALAKTAGSIFGMFEETLKAKTRELALIASQNHFRNPVEIEPKSL